MSGFTSTATWCPSSFQLKLGLSCRKSRVFFFRTRFSCMGRGGTSYWPVLIAQSSRVNGNGVGRSRSGSSWMMNSSSDSNSSVDNFSGWEIQDVEQQPAESPRKQSFSGILGAGVGGVLLVAGLTFAAFSISKRTTSRVGPQMEVLTVEQGKSSSSDNYHPDRVEEAISTDKLEFQESKSGMDKDPSTHKGKGEVNESRIIDDTGEEHSSEGGSITNGRYIQNAPSESSIVDDSVSLEAISKLTESDFVDGTLAGSRFQSDTPSDINAKILNEPEVEKAIGAKSSEASVDDADSANLTADDDGVSKLGVPVDAEKQGLQEMETLENAEFTKSSAFDGVSDNLDSDGQDQASGLGEKAVQEPPGKVLVPAIVDQLQALALQALQMLEVIEADVEPGELYTQREYARWLVAASSALSSLAEAGLIASKLSRRDMLLHSDEDPSPYLFSPESPLSRQDLVSWKMALEKRQLPVVDRKTLQQLSGFIDIDKIDPDAWPSLVADLAAGEQGIITLAFGYTRLFQPEKPVTKGQAAIALATGDASVIVSEELARIEAESAAEKAVAEHSALVAQVEKDLNASYEEELLQERERINMVEGLAEEAKQELEKLRKEREEEHLAFVKERAAVDSEMEILSRLRREVDEQLKTLMSDKLEISYEKERLNKLRRDAETENQEITRLQYELEVERKALSMARAWAEDEAKRAREQAKVLEEAREHWERHGIKVVVDKDLREEADAGATWLATGKLSVEETVERSESLVDKLRTMAEDVRGQSKDIINKIIQKILLIVSLLKEKVLMVSRQAGEVKDNAKSKMNSSLQQVRQSSAEFTSNLKDGAKRVVGDWKDGVGRFSQKFKT